MGRVWIQNPPRGTVLDEVALLGGPDETWPCWVITACVLFLQVPSDAAVLEARTGQEASVC